MAPELEECLPRLADVENADEVGVGGECCEEMRVVRGGSKAEEWRCV